MNSIRSMLPRWLAWSGYIVALSTSLPAQETLHTTDTAFHIPFNFDQGDESTDQVQLFFSNDEGLTWQLYQQLPPDAGRFTFRTPDDGNFWFTVRLQGVDNRAPKQPELIVAVDREKPQVELNLERDNSGRVIARWEIIDAHLDPESMQMQFVGSEGQWQPVPIESSSKTGDGAGLKGAAEWWVAPHQAVVEVRLRATDRAGNVALVERRLGSEPVADSATEENPHPAMVPGARATEAHSNTKPLKREAANGWTSSAAGNPASRGPTPPTGQVRTSRSRRFNLDYEVNDANSAVHRVEVWYTRDGGVTWKHLGDDGDRVSPHLVEVAEDGMYGFRLVVQATEGFFAKPPISGDTADVWVQIDSLPPTIRMIGAEFGGGPDWGTLRVSWESSDENPADHPVTLLFAESAEGPWRKLAEGQPSTGMYDWRLDQTMPARFYVRAEARDRVGNVTGQTWPEPLHSHHLHPRAKIRDIRPASRSLFGAPELR